MCIRDRPLRDEIPIYLAAVGLKNVEMTAEIADGWLPFMYSPLKGEEIYKDSLTNGFKKSGVSDKKDKFEIVTTVIGRVCDEEEVDEYLYPARNVYTLYVGGMGAKSKNFYYNLFCEYGYEDIADELQNLYLSGNKKESEKMFPKELLEELTLVGTKKDIEKKVEMWKESNVTEISLSLPIDFETVKFIKELL